MIRSNDKWNHRHTVSEITRLEALKHGVTPVQLCIESVAPTRLVKPNSIT